MHRPLASELQTVSHASVAESSIIKLSRVGKTFAKGLAVLDDINLTVRQGELVSIIGPSGCGKSTLLRLIAGLSPPSFGEISIDSKSPKEALKGIFTVFQDANLLPWLRVSGNIELPMMLRGIPSVERRDRVASMLDLVGLNAAVWKFPWQLSGGMKMRVSLARALSVSPRIMLLDEPFGALDEMTRQRLNEDLLTIRERDAFTGIFVTHSVAEAVFLSTRVVILSANPGRISSIVSVPFAYPRSSELRESPDYLHLFAEISRRLREVANQEPSKDASL